MNDIKQFKEKQINEFVSNNLNFDNPEDINVSQIKMGLRNLLGEEPAVRFNYKGDTIINEVEGTKKHIKKLESISIVYTYQDQNMNMILPGEVVFLVD